MPLARAYSEILEVYLKALECVVSITQAEESQSTEVNERRTLAGTGFVVHCSDTFSVVAVHPSFSFQGTKPVVKFWEGTEVTDTTLIRMSGPLNLIVANIPRGDWQEVKYSDIEGPSQIVVPIVSLMKKPTPFISRIISPRTICVDVRGKEIVETRHNFTINLPVAGNVLQREQTEDVKNESDFHWNSIIGGPVFDMYAHFVGFVNQCGLVFDVKYGVRSDYFYKELQKWLANRPWKDAIQHYILGAQTFTESSKRTKKN